MFFSAISFIILNIALGLFYVFAVRLVLFHPAVEWHIGRFKIPLTPGFIFKQKEYWVKKLHQLLEELLSDCHNYDYLSRISKLEKTVYNRVLEKMEMLDEIKYVPNFIADKVKQLVAQVCFELFRQFVRSFIPFLVEKYEVDSYIDLISQQINIYIVRDYYIKYIHRYLVYIVTVLFFLLGLFNMFVFLLVR